MTILGDVLRSARVHNEISIREFAKMIGIDKSALLRLEHGKPINQESLIKVILYLLEA
jgi:transcriptional regulator with XRE-family HTH domain